MLATNALLYKSNGITNFIQSRAMTTIRKQKEPSPLALTSRLMVSGQTLDVIVSQISGIQTTKKTSCQINLPRHSSLHKILLRPCKADSSQYRLINYLSPCVQTHLSQLKPDVLVEAFVISSKGEYQDRLDDFVFGELASILPKPQNSAAAKGVIAKMVQSQELLDEVVNGFELGVRSPNAFPTKAIAQLLHTAPGTVMSIIDEVELAPKWDQYAKANNLNEYRIMVKTLARHKDKNYKKGFIRRLRHFEVDSPKFAEFAAGAARCAADLLNRES